ncbi:MAG: PQQ-binding-like beta-propeller repeat protein [Planctomycetaceae bacterium]
MRSLLFDLCRAGLIMGLTISAASAGDWTEFRGPTGQGISDARDLPIHWSETENVAWKRAVPGLGWSSPVVAGGRVFLTTAIPKEPGPGHSLRVLCLDPESGETLWDVEAFDQPEGERVEKHQKNSHASPTPLVEGDHLYVHFGPHGTACLNAENGALVWKNQEIAYAPNHGNGGSPALAGDKLVICCDGRDVQFVLGLNKHTGEIAWKTDRGVHAQKGFSFSTPLVLEVQGRPQAICPGSGGVIAYDPDTGEEIWRVRYGEGYSVVPRPVFGAGLVFVCSGFGDERLLAIDPAGKGDVTDSHVKWTLDRGAPKSPSALVVGDELYCVDDNGIASCVDSRSGQVFWQRRLGGNYSASPLFAGGNVYFQDENGKAAVIRASTTYEEVSRNTLAGDERTFASYAVHEGALLVRSEGHLYRIGRPRPR